MNSSIRIGFDLDGVIAAHPFGGLFLALRKWKEHWLYRTHDSRYYYPDTAIEKSIWKLINRCRPPAKNAGGLLELLQNHNDISLKGSPSTEGESFLKDHEIFLITTRFGFLEEITINWLKKYHLRQLFHKVIINKNDLEPNEFKVKTVKELGLDYFVDDDLETLNILSKNTETCLIWVYPPHVNPVINKNPRITNCGSILDIRQMVTEDQSA